jgi:hypothetical protein
VVPDLKVPTEIALETAHLVALNQLLEAAPPGAVRREIEDSLPRIERSLQQKRQDLMAHLGGAR